MGKLQTRLIIAFAITLYVLADTVEAGVVDRDPRAYKQYNHPEPKKRPFCNAFTGCGRKRSDNSITEEQAQPEEESVSEMLDINSEPAIEDLMRQIMSEAKLWEAIQEANKEITQQKAGKPHYRNGLAFSQQ